MTPRRQKPAVPALGDIIEIPLSKGFAYAQYVKHHRGSVSHGELIRVLPGRFEKPVSDLKDLGRQEDLYCCFFPVGAAVKRGMVRIVGHAPVPRTYRKFPHFKSYNLNPDTGKKLWFIWDGKAAKSIKVERLSDEEKKYPMKQIVGMPVLVERIEKGWLPEHEV